MIFENGDILDGPFTDGVLHGKGIYYKAQGSVWTKGQFDDRRCLRFEKQGKGFPLEECYNVRRELSLGSRR